MVYTTSKFQTMTSWNAC